jgi:hypothetical protein
MPLPSFYRSDGSARPWNVVHAGCYGAAIGAVAALLKTLGPLGMGAPTPFLTDKRVEIAVAALIFALLCAAAATLRNFIARRLVWHERR